MNVRIKLFAIARERIGKSEVEVSLPEPATVADLRRVLLTQFPGVADVLPHIRVAINSSYASDATVIPLEAEVALIPPVSGG